MQLQFQSDLQITHMYSGEGEEVRLSVPVSPSGNVEHWLREVENSMKASVRDNISRSLQAYVEVSICCFLCFLSMVPLIGINHYKLSNALDFFGHNLITICIIMCQTPLLEGHCRVQPAPKHLPRSL